MISKWNIVLEKEVGNITVGSYKNKKHAQEEIEYRYTLCRHMGYEPDISYILQKATTIK